MFAANVTKQRSVSKSKAESCMSKTIYRYSNGSFDACKDSIIQECLLDVRVNGSSYRSLTCSPWDIEELVTGFLYLDGVISSRHDIVRFIVNSDLTHVDVVTASADSCAPSRCLRSDAAALPLHAAASPSVSLTPAEVNHCASVLENESALFHRTGGVHSAVLIGPLGLEAWFEDISRHSAVDKLAGWCVLNDVDPRDKVLVFSGRVPHEIISKVAAMGWPAVISPGAPTGLSIEIAERERITLIGFAKKGRFNVYSCADRIHCPDGVAHRVSA